MAAIHKGLRVDALSVPGRPAAAEPRQHDHVRHRYRGFARHYDRSFGRYTAWSREIILGTVADLAAPSWILDVCCGTGVMTAALADRFPAAQIVGLDLSSDMLSRAQSRLAALIGAGRGAAAPSTGGEAPPPRVRLVEAPAERLPIESASADLLICANAFHLVDRQQAAIGEFARVLAPGGRAVILDWTSESAAMRLLVRWLHLTQKAQRRLHSRESLSRLVRKAGLEVEFTRRERIPPFWGLMLLRVRKPAAPGAVDGAVSAPPTRTRAT